MMKRILLILSVLLLFSVFHLFADFQKGLDPYDNEDYVTALNALRPLAEQGSSFAQYELGVMYANGRGVPEDDREAVKWYTLAAEQGYVPAQTNLGWMYSNGRGVPEDDREAVKWYTLAAEQGEKYAQFNLGLMYYFGEGVLEDYVYAYMWWNIASSLGNENATNSEEIVAEKMSRSQIAEAQQLSQRCLNSNYEDCK